MTRIAANLITGFLGTGKTTAIRSLLQRRPAGKRWAIFINEYGMVSIDDALLDQETSGDVAVQELAGGCFCCETSMLFRPMLVQFLRRARPDRLIIEPSGVGHPARVLDALRESEFFQRTLDLRATLCIVDPKDYENPRTRDNPVFHDQIEMADVVVLNHADHRTPECLAGCRAWVEQADPPKLLIVQTSFGELQPEWLDLNATLIRPPRFADAHGHHQSLPDDSVPPLVSVTLGAGGVNIDRRDPLLTIPAPEGPGRPVRLENSSQDQRACGWIFSRDDVFDRNALLDLSGTLSAQVRFKGIFRCTDDWWAINRSDSAHSIKRSAWRRDSRVELITNRPDVGWPDVEHQLLACRARSGVLTNS